MTELKRPERHFQPESIKPKLSSITNFYTQKVNEYWNRIKQLNEYVDALENEISVLKETPKVKVLLDDTAKPLVVVPQCVDDAIKALPDYYSVYGAIEWIRAEIIEFVEEKEDWIDVYNWIFKENNANKFARAWLDGYTVKKEQLYEVVFYIDEEDDRCLLMKTGKTILFEFESQNEGHYKQQFTEQEIKAIDKRYLAFAVKVDEVNP